MTFFFGLNTKKKANLALNEKTWRLPVEWGLSLQTRDSF